MVKTFRVESRVELSDSGEFRGVITFPEINDRWRGAGLLSDSGKYEVRSVAHPELTDGEIFLPGSMRECDGDEIVINNPEEFAEVLECLMAASLELSKQNIPYLKAEEVHTMTKEHVEKANRYIAHAFSHLDEEIGEFSYDDEKSPEENAWDLCAWKGDTIERVLNRLPLGADPCPFCQTFMKNMDGTCSDCSFGKEKGVCISGDDSKYATARQALSDLRHAIRDMYQR